MAGRGGSEYVAVKGEREENYYKDYYVTNSQNPINSQTIVPFQGTD